MIYLLIASLQANTHMLVDIFAFKARPDFQGGSTGLGYWNLYGRLLNEGPMPH